jgi:hypothetical protein
MRHSFLLAALLVTSLASLAMPACADDRVWLTGVVLASDGRPLSNAVVAVYDDKQKVVDHAKTDEDGRYALLVSTKDVHLGGGSKGFFHQVTSGVSRLVGGVAGIAALPVRAGMKAAAAALPATDPITRAQIAAASSVADLAMRAVVPEGHPAKSNVPPHKRPGAFLMKVSRDGHSGVVGTAQVYWMEEEVTKIGDNEKKNIIAWVDPVKLAPDTSKADSEIGSRNLYFTEARISPTIAERGQTIRIDVTIPTPQEPRTPIIVVARHQPSGQLFELRPTGRDRYTGEFVVDKRFPLNDQAVVVVAYAEQREGAGRDKKVEDALAGAGCFDPKKEYIYNPLLAASRNRALQMLTVVGSGKR